MGGVFHRSSSGTAGCAAGKTYLLNNPPIDRAQRFYPAKRMITDAEEMAAWFPRVL